MVSYEEGVLLAWDVAAEQRKVEFLDKLYFFYEPSTKTYSGITQRFLQDVHDYYRGLGRFQNSSIANKFESFLLTLR